MSDLDDSDDDNLFETPNPDEEARPEFIVWVSLGSNIRPQYYLPKAVESLAMAGTIEAASSVWQSQSVGNENLPDFCNAAVLLRTELDPLELKQTLLAIESHLGRVRDPDDKNASRTIDLDISLFEDLVLDYEGLTIPDPLIESRPFIVVPLAELTPDMDHPVSKLKLREIANQVGGTASLTKREDIELAF